MSLVVLVLDIPTIIPKIGYNIPLKTPFFRNSCSIQMPNRGEISAERQASQKAVAQVSTDYFRGKEKREIERKKKNYRYPLRN